MGDRDAPLLRNVLGCEWSHSALLLQGDCHHSTITASRGARKSEGLVTFPARGPQPEKKDNAIGREVADQRDGHQVTAQRSRLIPRHWPSLDRFSLAFAGSADGLNPAYCMDISSDRKVAWLGSITGPREQVLRKESTVHSNK